MDMHEYEYEIQRLKQASLHSRMELGNAASINDNIIDDNNNRNNNHGDMDYDDLALDAASKLLDAALLLAFEVEHEQEQVEDDTKPRPISYPMIISSSQSQDPHSFSKKRTCMSASRQPTMSTISYSRPSGSQILSSTFDHGSCVDSTPHSYTDLSTTEKRKWISKLAREVTETLACRPSEHVAQQYLELVRLVPTLALPFASSLFRQDKDMAMRLLQEISELVRADRSITLIAVDALSSLFQEEQVAEETKTHEVISDTLVFALSTVDEKEIAKVIRLLLRVTLKRAEGHVPRRGRRPSGDSVRPLPGKDISNNSRPLVLDHAATTSCIWNKRKLDALLQYGSSLSKDQMKDIIDQNQSADSVNQHLASPSGLPQAVLWELDNMWKLPTMSTLQNTASKRSEDGCSLARAQNHKKIGAWSKQRKVDISSTVKLSIVRNIQIIRQQTSRIENPASWQSIAEVVQQTSHTVPYLVSLWISAILEMPGSFGVLDLTVLCLRNANRGLKHGARSEDDIIEESRRSELVHISLALRDHVQRSMMARRIPQVSFLGKADCSLEHVCACGRSPRSFSNATTVSSHGMQNVSNSLSFLLFSVLEVLARNRERTNEMARAQALQFVAQDGQHGKFASSLSRLHLDPAGFRSLLKDSLWDYFGQQVGQGSDDICPDLVFRWNWKRPRDLRHIVDLLEICIVSWPDNSMYVVRDLIDLVVNAQGQILEASNTGVQSLSVRTAVFLLGELAVRVRASSALRCALSNALYLLDEIIYSPNGLAVGLYEAVAALRIAAQIMEDSELDRFGMLLVKLSISSHAEDRRYAVHLAHVLLEPLIRVAPSQVNDVIRVLLSSILDDSNTACQFALLLSRIPCEALDKDLRQTIQDQRLSRILVGSSSSLKSLSPWDLDILSIHGSRIEFWGDVERNSFFAACAASWTLQYTSRGQSIVDPPCLLDSLKFTFPGRAASCLLAMAEHDCSLNQMREMLMREEELRKKKACDDRQGSVFRVCCGSHTHAQTFRELSDEELLSACVQLRNAAYLLFFALSQHMHGWPVSAMPHGCFPCLPATCNCLQEAKLGLYVVAAQRHLQASLLAAALLREREKPDLDFTNKVDRRSVLSFVSMTTEEVFSKGYNYLSDAAAMVCFHQVTLHPRPNRSTSNCEHACGAFESLNIETRLLSRLLASCSVWIKEDYYYGEMIPSSSTDLSHSLSALVWMGLGHCFRKYSGMKKDARNACRSMLDTSSKFFLLVLKEREDGLKLARCLMMSIIYQSLVHGENQPVYMALSRFVDQAMPRPAEERVLEVGCQGFAGPCSVHPPMLNLRMSLENVSTLLSSLHSLFEKEILDFRSGATVACLAMDSYAIMVAHVKSMLSNPAQPLVPEYKSQAEDLETDIRKKGRAFWQSSLAIDYDFDNADLFRRFVSKCSSSSTGRGRVQPQVLVANGSIALPRKLISHVHEDLSARYRFLSYISCLSKEEAWFEVSQWIRAFKHHMDNVLTSKASVSSTSIGIRSASIGRSHIRSFETLVGCSVLDICLAFSLAACSGNGSAAMEPWEVDDTRSRKSGVHSEHYFDETRDENGNEDENENSAHDVDGLDMRFALLLEGASLLFRIQKTGHKLRSVPGFADTVDGISLSDQISWVNSAVKCVRKSASYLSSKIKKNMETSNGVEFELDSSMDILVVSKLVQIQTAALRTLVQCIQMIEKQADHDLKVFSEERKGMAQIEKYLKAVPRIRRDLDFARGSFDEIVERLDLDVIPDHSVTASDAGGRKDDQSDAVSTASYLTTATVKLANPKVFNIFPSPSAYYLQHPLLKVTREVFDCLQTEESTLRQRLLAELVKERDQNEFFRQRYQDTLMSQPIGPWAKPKIWADSDWQEPSGLTPATISARKQHMEIEGQHESGSAETSKRTRVRVVDAASSKVGSGIYAVALDTSVLDSGSAPAVDGDLIDEKRDTVVFRFGTPY